MMVISSGNRAMSSFLDSFNNQNPPPPATSPGAADVDFAAARDAVEKSGQNLQHLSAAMKDNDEIVGIAVKSYGPALAVASQRLRNDHAIVVAATRKDWQAFQYASGARKNDPETARAVIEINWQTYEYLSNAMKQDTEIAMRAIRQSWMAIYKMPPSLLDDKEIMREAVLQDTQAFEMASPRLRGDPDIVRIAAMQDGALLCFASAELRDDKDFLLPVVRAQWSAIQYASDKLRDDADVVRAAVGRNAQAYKSASPRLQKDPSIARLALEGNPYLLPEMPVEIRGDRAIMLDAVQRNGMALKHAAEELRNDRDLVLAAIAQNWRAHAHASESLQEDPAVRDAVARERARQSSTRKQAINFLWLGLDLPAKPDPDNGSIRLPMPEEYINNVREAALRHPGADINLWVDSRRLTEKQLGYLKAVTEDKVRNLHVKDLCAIPAYRDEELYNRTETKRDWRSGYRGVVWLQVDAAKILIPLQGDYDRSFFADLDHAHLDIESGQVRSLLDRHGLLIGGSDGYSTSLENQLWGFDRSRRVFFEDYYSAALDISYKGEIGYGALYPTVRNALDGFEGISSTDICLPIGSRGLTHAEHPGHAWSERYEGRTHVPARELAEIFNPQSAPDAERGVSAAANENMPPREMAPPARKAQKTVLARKARGPGL